MRHVLPLLLLAGGAWAAEGPSLPARKAMTLAEALAHARAHQPAIRVALARIEVRRHEARVPRAAWLPQIGATAQLFYGTANNTTASYLNVPEVDLPRIGATRATSSLALSPSASTLAAISVGQEIYDFGRLAAQSAAADALLESARADGSLVDLDVALGVEEAFDAVLAGGEIVSAASDAYKRAVAHRDFAAAGVKSGMRPPIDLTRAAADLAQADVRRTRADTSLTAARSVLAAAIGSESLEVDALSGGEAAASGSPGLGEALELARAHSPALASALFRIRAKEATTKAIGAEMLPNLFASAGVSARAGGAQPSSGEPPTGDGWLPDVLNWHAGLVLQWNVFDATVLARRSASRAAEAQARAEFEGVRLDTVVAVERAYLDLQAATQTIPGLVQAVTAAQANLAQADARFRAGLGTAVELADAEALLTGAQVDLAIGRFAANRARAQLARAIGTALHPPSGGTP